MDFKAENWLVVTINSDKEMVTSDVDISKKFCSSFEEAKEYMNKKAQSYKKAKEIISEKLKMYIDCETYFVQIEIIDCSKTIKIIG